jgi:hypothetical protein
MQTYRFSILSEKITDIVTADTKSGSLKTLEFSSVWTLLNSGFMKYIYSYFISSHLAIEYFGIIKIIKNLKNVFRIRNWTSYEHE